MRDLAQLAASIEKGATQLSWIFDLVEALKQVGDFERAIEQAQETLNTVKAELASAVLRRDAIQCELLELEAQKSNADRIKQRTLSSAYDEAEKIIVAAKEEAALIINHAEHKISAKQIKLGATHGR